MLAEAVWEAVEAKIWKQAAATALQKIHEQALAFDDEECDQIFTAPVPKGTPGYYELIKQPTSLMQIGRELTDVRTKTLWHTRHGLVRYFANISLMCDNCRLYEQHHGNDMEIRAWADKMQSYVERLLVEEQTKTEQQVRDALYSLASRR